MLTWNHAPALGHRVAGPRSIGPGVSPTAAAVLALQRAAGNTAVAGLIVQRDGAPGPITLPPVEMTGAGPSLPGIPVGIGPPPALADDAEADYRSKGDARLGAIGGAGGAAAGAAAAGHTPGGPIEGFPDWFSTLQRALIGSAQWRKDVEEPAQQLLAEYALKRFAVPHKGDTSKVPPTVRIYCQYIGRSTSNQRAAAAAGLPSSKDMGGAQGATMWCAACGSSSVEMAIHAAGLEFDSSKKARNAWLNAPPVPSVGMPKAAVDARIEPGDQVSYIGGGAPAIGGHTVTALSASQGEGTVFNHASGNAGGGSSGSIRLGSSSPRAKLPASITLTDIQKKSPADLNAPGDRVWIYIIVQYSRFWEDLGRVDTTAPGVWSSGPGKAFVDKYLLKPARVTA